MEAAKSGHESSGRRSWLSGAVAAGIVAILPAWPGIVPQGSAAEPRGGADRGSSVGARRETRALLDPGRFVGKARRAHEVAHQIPDVLDRLYCYCFCDRSIGHKSLLSCYTDGHAAT